MMTRAIGVTRKNMVENHTNFTKSAEKVYNYLNNISLTTVSCSVEGIGAGVAILDTSVQRCSHEALDEFNRRSSNYVNITHK